MFLLYTTSELDLRRGCASTELSESVIKSIIKCVVAVVFFIKVGFEWGDKKAKN